MADGTVRALPARFLGPLAWLRSPAWPDPRPAPPPSRAGEAPAEARRRGFPSTGNPGGDPLVTVLLCVHNGGAFLEPALRSVMTQTLREIEILVVDDCSTDGTPGVLARLAAEDGRIRVERLPANLRLPGALNHGLRLARAPLVARMDADDLCHPTRLEVQRRFLLAHPQVGAVGTSLRRIRADGAVFQTAVRPRDAAMCRWVMRFRPPVAHPTIMFRLPMPDGWVPTYDTAYPCSEDYDLFVRMLDHGPMVCLPDVLLDYRDHDANTTKVQGKRQNADAERICRAFLARELPADLVGDLDPAVTAFYRFTKEPAEDILHGLRRMLGHDLRRTPARAAWLRRQTAQLAFDVVRRSGRSHQDVLRAFATSAPDLLAHLALRFAEIGHVLPPPLRSHADVWSQPGAAGNEAQA